MVTLGEALGTGAGGRTPRAYVARAGVDDRFHRALEDGTHIAVYGTPGVGKTSLIQRYVDGSQLLYVECRRRQQAPDVYRSILAEAGARVKTETRLTKKRQLSATLKIFSGGGEHDVENTETEITIDLGNVGDVFRTLTAHTERPLVVLNDFQCLARKAQRRIVQDLQYVYERTPARVILVGTWVTPAYLTDLTELLPSFLTDVAVPAWSDEQAAELLTTVEGLLGVSFAPDLRAALVEMSAGSVRELTDLTRALLADLGVRVDQKPRLEIGLTDRLAGIAERRVARLHGRYRTLLRGYLTATLASTDGVDLGRFFLNSCADIFSEAHEDGDGDIAGDDGGGARTTRYGFDELEAALAATVADTNAPLVEEQQRRRGLIELLADGARRDGSEVAVSAADLAGAGLDGVACDEYSFRASAQALVRAQDDAGFHPPLVTYDPRAGALVALEPKFRAFLRTAAGDIATMEVTERLPVDGPGYSAWTWRDSVAQHAAINRWRSHHPTATTGPAPAG